MFPSEDNQIINMVDHLFRHEAGKMVAVLTRLFGFANIEQAEDIVQDTIIKALETWKFSGIPANPQAWLYKVAKNNAIDVIRRQQLKYKIDSKLAVLLQSEYTLSPAVAELFTAHEITDSQLRMMFVCCHPSVSQEAQITLILKTLCGLSAKEIGSAFLTNEETINKRLYRTKEKIRNEHIPLEYPNPVEIQKRTEAVIKALYLLFNEGYSSSHTGKLIREDLCEEAMRLAILLTENEQTNIPETNALLALMCFQASRFKSRLDDKGFVVLLKDQDRSQWNHFLIIKGNDYLQKAAAGYQVHPMHIEAGIASLHANAASYETTDWSMILQLYNRLLEHTYNPVVALNRCLVLAEVEGPETAIAELEKLTEITQTVYYKTSAGELYFKAGDISRAKQLYTEALKLTASAPEAELIERKIKLCL